MSKQQPEAQFDLTTGSMMINQSIQDFLEPVESTTEDVDDNYEDDEDVDDTTLEDQDDNDQDTNDDEEDEDEDDKPSKKTKKSSKDEEEDDDDPYKDYSDLALAVLAIKQEDPDLMSFDIKDIKKDMTSADFVNTIKDSVNKVVKEEKELLEQKYQGAAEYISFLIEGGSAEVVQKGLKLKQISDIELDDEIEEEDLIHIVTEGLRQKGINDDDEIKDLIETFKNKGKLYDKAEDTINLFKKLEKDYIDNATKQRKAEIEEATRRSVETKKKIEDIINKGIVKGIPIKDKKNLINAIYHPTETVEKVTQDGKKVLVKDTLYNIKYKEFNNDLEQQVAFAQLLVDGFDFTEIVKVAKKSANEDIIKILDNRTDKKTKSRINGFYSL